MLISKGLSKENIDQGFQIVTGYLDSAARNLGQAAQPHVSLRCLMLSMT